MKRGDIVTAAAPGDFGKPRPALVVQALFDLEPERVTLALITSDLQRVPYLRIPVEPTPENGLARPSEVAVDNIQTLAIRRVGEVIGQLDEATMELVEDAILRHFGLG